MSAGERPFKIVSIILLALVLVISWSAYSSTRVVRQQVQALQGELHSLHSQLTHDLGSIRGTVSSIQDQSRWYTTPQVEVTGIENEEAALKVSWNLREYVAGSNVTLNYRFGEQTSFTAVEATEENSGYFSAEIGLDIPLEPRWSVSESKTVSSRTSGDPRQVTLIEEKSEYQRGSGSSRLMLEYYITMHEGEMTRTSDHHAMDLTKLSYNLFNALDLHVRWDEEGQVKITLHEMPSGDPYYTLQAATLESRRENATVESWQLQETEIKHRAPQPASGHADIFQISTIPQKAYDSLFIVVEYSGGVTVEKEISGN